MTSSNGSDKTALERSYKYNPTMPMDAAERVLKEVKQVMDQLGVPFVLGSGTCLGAVRNKAFIPWDDDIDLASVIGINGHTEGLVEKAISAFENHGFFMDIRRSDETTVHTSQGDAVITPYMQHGGISISMIKDFVRVGWDSLRVIQGSVIAYPGIRLPARLFAEPKQIEFLGEMFFVPNPPEEYLRLKYGPEWTVPKKAGVYEKDIVALVPDATLEGLPSRIRVLNHDGLPVPAAEVALAGGRRSKTDEHGYAEIIVPRFDWYALTVRYPGHEEVLYMERIGPDKTYVYMSDPNATTSRFLVLSTE